MASLASELSVMGMDGPVEDRTGLEGKYDFTLMKWQNDDGSISWDLEALGLKLNEILIPSQKVVIDHIERPSEN